MHAVRRLVALAARVLDAGAPTIGPTVAVWLRDSSSAPGPPAWVPPVLPETLPVPTGSVEPPAETHITSILSRGWFIAWRVAARLWFRSLGRVWRGGTRQPFEKWGGAALAAVRIRGSKGSTAVPCRLCGLAGPPG